MIAAAWLYFVRRVVAILSVVVAVFYWDGPNWGPWSAGDLLPASLYLVVIDSLLWPQDRSLPTDVRDTTSSVPIVGAPMHATARDDMERLLAAVDDEVTTIRSVTPRASALTQASPQLDF